ncbi:hypothetical protein HHX47_DHR6000625 [Lentinula edodes]|nr:hypothetical protein HHX47_DHR6000625 [Lentinula edodes]
MERMFEDMSHKGTTFDTDQTLRTKKLRGNGQLAQDLGSSGFASKHVKQSHKPSIGSRSSKERVERGSPSGSKHKKPVEDYNEEPDELDFLSGMDSENELDTKSSMPLVSSQLSTHDPEHQLARSNTLKGLKFNKNKSENDNASIPSKPRGPSSSILEPKSPNLSSAFRLSPPTKPAAKSSSQSRKVSQSSHVASRKPSVEKASSRSVLRVVGSSSSSDKDDARSIRRTKGERKGLERSTPAEPLPSKKARPRPKPLPAKSSSSSVSSALLKPPVGKLQPAPPADLPVSLSPEHTPRMNPKSLLSKPERFPLAASPERENTPKNHKSLLNVRPAAFPLSPSLSGRRKDVQKKSASNQYELMREDSDDDEALSKTKTNAVSKAAPFPLNSPYPKSMISIPNKSVGKRSSNVSPQEDDSPLKRQRRDDDMVISSPPQNLHYSDDSDDDDYFYNPSVDASTLCPYCDEPLPASPTPHLKHLLATTAKKSIRAPRPTNPMGRKTAVSVFINVCQRHQFESKILPEAEAKGWPKSIGWDLIHERVMRMKNHLEALMENSMLENERGDVDYDEEGDAGEGSGQCRRARDKCVFWEDVIKEVKQKGTRAAANVKSQFANFQNTQPGYYGELGSVLIHQSLYELFPPESTPLELVSPLSPKEFINRVLLPEVALRLIMEDKSLSGSSGARKALEILRDSTTYGVAMFPEDAGERVEGASAKLYTKGKRKGKGKEKAKETERYHSEDTEIETTEMSVADKMVREKARRRRLELEKETEQEEMIHQEQTKRHRKGKSKRKNPVVQTPSPQNPKPKPRPKPKAIQKNASPASLAGMDVGSEPEAGWRSTFSDGPAEYSDNNGMDMEASDVDASNELVNWALDDPANMDAFFLTTENNRSPPNSISGLSFSSKLRDVGFPPSSSSSKPDSAGSTSHTMIISSSEDSDSNIRKSRKQTRKMSTRTRSPSIKISSPDPKPISVLTRPPPSSFDMDDTPKANRSQLSMFPEVPSTSFSRRNGGGAVDRNSGETHNTDSDVVLKRWHNDPDSAPLAFLRQSRSRPNVQKAPS